MKRYQLKTRVLLATTYGTLLYTLILIIPNSFDYLSGHYQVGDHIWMVLLAWIYQEMHFRGSLMLKKYWGEEEFPMVPRLLQSLGSLFLGLFLAYMVVNFEFHQIKANLRESNFNSPIEAFEYVMNLRIYIIFASVALLDELIFHTIDFFAMYQRKAWEAEQIRKDTILNQLTSLKNQIQPNFWFACLNTLKTLVHQSPEKSEKFIKKLSYYYRHSLNHSEKELISLEDEIAFVHTYWYLVQAGQAHPATLRAALDELNYQKLIPSKALQKLLERLLEAWQASGESSLDIHLQTWGDSLEIHLYMEGRPAQMDLITFINFDELTRIYQFYTDRPVELIENRILLPLLELSLYGKS